MTSELSPKWTKGHSAGLLAFTIWGLFPLYWKIFATLDAYVISFWRFIFTAITLILIVSFLKQWSILKKSLKIPKVLTRLLLASSLIATNWIIFMWAITHQLTWQSSLGYYISPLITVSLGAIILKEKLQSHTKISLLFATTGILFFLVNTGSLPIVSLVIAATFSFYGFIKKKIDLPAHLGMTFETLMTLPLCLIYLLWSPIHSQYHLSIGLWVLLALSGILTILPMFLYNFSAQKIPLNNLGMLQFISPTLQFITAEFIFHEDIDTYKLYSFTFIWTAVLIYLFGPIIWKIFKVKNPKIG
jgi:chloramphenicol-sensitive protein RarD